MREPLEILPCFFLSFRKYGCYYIYSSFNSSSLSRSAPASSLSDAYNGSSNHLKFPRRPDRLRRTSVDALTTLPAPDISSCRCSSLPSDSAAVDISPESAPDTARPTHRHTAALVSALKITNRRNDSFPQLRPAFLIIKPSKLTINLYIDRGIVLYQFPQLLYNVLHPLSPDRYPSFASHNPESAIC